MPEPLSAADWNERGAAHLPGLLGLRVTSVEPGQVQACIDVGPQHLAPNGYLHAATVVALADTCCGYGCVNALPEDATGFTTVELKSNHLGTARDGTIACTATMTHGGRTTQVWDAVVTNQATGSTVALFRCTQLVLRPAR